MKKTMMIIIALFVVLTVTVSSRSDRQYEAVRGFEVPSLSLIRDNDSSAIELSDLRGRYTLVNFWAASDAESRIAAFDYSRMAETVGDERLSLVQVNLDPSVRLFREIVRRDSLKEAQQYKVADASRENLTQVFHLGSGLQSYLIDPDGKIIAVNPSARQVAEIAGA